MLNEVDSLFDIEENVEDDEENVILPKVSLLQSKSTISIGLDLSNALRRLESIYAKLWFTLRYTVKVAFCRHLDVLEAGTFIQVRANFFFYVT
jgi:hypothetical protein